MEGKILKVDRHQAPALSGSSGITIQFETDLLLAGFQPGRIVKIRAETWPKIKLPVEERITNLEDRWPSAEIFK